MVTKQDQIDTLAAANHELDEELEGLRMYADGVVHSHGQAMKWLQQSEKYAEEAEREVIKLRDTVLKLVDKYVIT